MQTLKRQLSKISPISIGIILIFAVVMTFIIVRSFAAIGPASLYTNPAGTQSVIKGKTFTTTVRVSTASDVPVTAASVYLSYTSSKLSVQSVSYSGSPYNIEAAQTNSGGILRMDRAALPAISGGDKLFAKVTFKAKSTGSATIGFTSSSYVTSGEDDSDLSLQRNGTVYNISASTSGGRSSSDSGSGSSSSSDDSGTTSTSQSTDTSGSSSTSTSSESGEKSNKVSKNTAKGIDKSSTSADTSPLEVIVIDQEKQPVEGAEVTINGQTVKTNKEGIAVFDVVSVGEHDLVVDYNGNKTFSTVHVKGDSTTMGSDSIVVMIKRGGFNPLIWVAIPLVGLLLLAGVFYFKKDRWRQLIGRFKRSKMSLDQNQIDDPGLPLNPNSSPPGSTFSPDSNDPSIAPDGLSQDNKN